MEHLESSGSNVSINGLIICKFCEGKKDRCIDRQELYLRKKYIGFTVKKNI